MSQDKKLTLQEYIECHNVKRQLMKRSKQKSRNKSPSMPSTDGINNSNSVQTNPKQKTFLSSHEQLSKSIYNQADYRARNLYFDLENSINQVKLDCRSIIKNDKDFAAFNRLMDGLMQKFRHGVMQIHRQNLVLFQISQSAQNNSMAELGRSYLEKSFHENWLESKNQFQINSSFLPQKSIKEKMQETRRGEDFVKTIFGGLAGEMTKDAKLMPKKYQTEPMTEQERQRRKQEAVSFLGFILRNLAQTKKVQQNKKVDDDKFVRDINLLNSCGKVDINTEQIDQYYDEHNMSFGNNQSINMKQTQDNAKSTGKTFNVKKCESINDVIAENRQIIQKAKISRQKSPLLSQQAEVRRQSQSKNQNARSNQLMQKENETRKKSKQAKPLSIKKAA